LIQDFFLAVRFAAREMRAGLRGFIIFFSCIVLGVTAMAGVGGVSSLISNEFALQGQTILGGDVRITITQDEATAEELAYFTAQGQVASSIWMRSMIRLVEAPDQVREPSATASRQQLAEIKAIDDVYPLYGTFETAPVGNFQTLFAPRDGIAGVVLAPALLQRLGAEIGDLVEIGTHIFEIRAVVTNEPDLLSEGLQLGLRVFMARDVLTNTGLLQKGSLYAQIYKIAMLQSANLDGFQEQLKQKFPQRRWNLRERTNAAPTLEVNIKRFLQFLTLVGLTALIIGGTGIAQAVSVYLEKKREVIAIFKTLGASGAFIVRLYLIQIMMIGLMAIMTGLGLALLVPIFVKQILHSFMPMSDGLVFYPFSLLNAAGFAFFSILAFALIPLGRTRDSHVTTLFRSVNITKHATSPLLYRLTCIFLLLLIAGCAVLLGNDRRLALIFIVAMAGVFLVLKFLDLMIESLARRFSHSRFLGIRLALGNIHRPGSLTAAVIRALGLSLTLLVALTTLDGNLRRQLSATTLNQAPVFFFLDIAGTEGELFRQSLARLAPEGKIEMMPTLRARITHLKNIPAEQADIDEDGRWVLRGDRNVGFSHHMTEETILTKGTWWEENYNGPPLVSFSAREAARLKLDIGDQISVNVLGRTIEARIASLRKVDWDSMKMNFVMIFSPNTFVGAPYSYLATLTMAPDEEKEAEIATRLGQDFPSMTIISTRDTLQNARDLADQIGLGVLASAAIVLLTSILVLAGALSAGNEKRAQMAVILKILGARRRTLMGAFILEYALLGSLTALFAFIAGSSAGIWVAKFRMNLSQVTLIAESAIFVLVAALILSVGLGLISTWRILGQKPSRVLREL